MRKQRYTLPAFVGGLNDTANKVEIKDNEAAVATNVRLDETGAVMQRGGYTAYGNDAGNSKCLGLFEYRRSTGNTQYAVFGTDVYKYVAGTWTAQSLTLTASKLAHFINFDNEMVMANGAQFKTLNDTTWADVGGSPPSAPALIEHWQNRVFAWNSSTTSANTLFWSASGNVDSWDTTNDSLDIPTANDGDLPTALLRDGQERLLCFKERSIHAITSVATGSASRRSISETIGAVSQRSVVRVPNGVIFLSRGEKTPTVYFLSGNRLTDLSTARIGASMAGLNHAQLAQACAMHYDHYYVLSVPSSGTSYPDVTYILDLNLSTEDNAVWVKDTGYSPSVWALFETSNKFTPYFGEAQANSFVYLFDTGSTDDPGGVDTAISSEYRTKFFDFGSDTRFRRVDMILAAQSSESIVKFYFAQDFNGDGAITNIDANAGGALWGTMVWGSGEWGGVDVLQGSLDINSRAKLVQFAWAMNTAGKTFKLYPRVEVIYHPRGVR